MKQLPFLLSSFFLVSSSLATEIIETDADSQDIESALDRKKKAEIQKESIELEKQNKIAQSDLDKFGFGLGFGVMFLGDPDIKSAVIENDTVKITDEEDNKMGFWLTTSWIHDSWPTSQIGFGPFFGIQLGGNNEIVNSVSAGIDFSFKRIAPSVPLDIQLGYGITRIETLAQGYTENSAAPTGSTQALKKKTTESGWVLIFSYNL